IACVRTQVLKIVRLLPRGFRALHHQAKLPNLFLGGLYRNGMLEGRGVGIFGGRSGPAAATGGGAVPASVLCQNGERKQQEQHGNNSPTAAHHRSSLVQIVTRTRWLPRLRQANAEAAKPLLAVDSGPARCGRGPGGSSSARTFAADRHSRSALSFPRCSVVFAFFCLWGVV